MFSSLSVSTLLTSANRLPIWSPSTGTKANVTLVHSACCKQIQVMEEQLAGRWPNSQMQAKLKLPSQSQTVTPGQWMFTVSGDPPFLPIIATDLQWVLGSNAPPLCSSTSLFLLYTTFAYAFHLIMARTAFYSTQQTSWTHTGIKPAQGISLFNIHGWRHQTTRTRLGRGKSEHWYALLSYSHLAKYLLVCQHENYNI